MLFKENDPFLLTLDSNVNIWQLLEKFISTLKQAAFTVSIHCGEILTKQLCLLKLFWWGGLILGNRRLLRYIYVCDLSVLLSSIQLWFLYRIVIVLSTTVKTRVCLDVLPDSLVDTFEQLKLEYVRNCILYLEYSSTYVSYIPLLSLLPTWKLEKSGSFLCWHCKLPQTRMQVLDGSGCFNVKTHFIGV